MAKSNSNFAKWDPEWDLEWDQNSHVWNPPLFFFCLNGHFHLPIPLTFNYQQVQLSNTDCWLLSDVCLLVFTMPVVPLHHKLLNELDDIDHSFKWTHLKKYLQDTQEDFLDLNNNTFISSCSFCSSVSSLSTISSDSLLSLDSDNLLDNLSTQSLSLTNLENMISHSLQAELDVFCNDIKLAWVL